MKYTITLNVYRVILLNRANVRSVESENTEIKNKNVKIMS